MNQCIRSLLGFFSSICLIIALGITSSTHAATVYWDAGGGGGAPPYDGFYFDTLNWLPNGLPSSSDTASFYLNQSYDVIFTANAAADAVEVTDGQVSFISDSATIRTYDLTSGLTVQGGTLNVGDILGSLKPVELSVGSGQLLIGDATADGEVVVRGANSRLEATETFQFHHISDNGYDGTLTFEDNAEGLINGVINVGHGAGDGQGLLNVLSGADLTTKGIDVGTDVTDATGTIKIDGIGSTLTQQSVAPFNLGSDWGGTGTIHLLNQGTFTSGTGSTTVNATGHINIANGTYNANGFIDLDGGTLYRTSLSEFNLATGKSLDAYSDAQATFSGDYDLSDSTTFNFTQGADLDVTSWLDIGRTTTGTLVVDGLGSELTVGNLSYWGTTGGTANVTFSDRAAAMLNDISLAEGSAAGTTGTWSVESGADVDVSNIYIADGGPTGGAGTLTLTGTGTTLTQTGSSYLIIGHASNGTATVNVLDSSTFNTGTGQTTVHATGTLNIDGGTLYANGDILVNGGTFTRTSGLFILDSSKTLTAQNDGLVDFGSGINLGRTFNFNTGADFTVGQLDIGNGFSFTGNLVVEGAGSTLTSISGGFWGGGDGTADVTIRDQATADIAVVFLAASPSSNGTWNVESDADVNVGTVTIGDGGGVGSLTVTGAGSTVTQTGAISLVVGDVADGSGLLTVSDSAIFSTGTGTTTVNTTGTIELDGGTFNLNGPMTGNGNLHFNSGQLSIITPTQSVGFGPSNLRIGGLTTATLPVLDGTKVLNVAGKLIVEPGGNLTVQGASMSTGGMIVLGGGSFNYQSGSIGTGPFQASAASTVDLQADVSLGDAAAANGIFIEGSFDVHDNLITLLDANDAVFDSGAFVSLGEGSNPGGVVAANGLTLDFGGNISGYGLIDTPDNAATPVINNGHITGNSLSEPVVLSGYVKGVGTCDFCDITGTDAPGFSPAAVTRGSVAYNGTLEIEIGGTSPGSEFDQLNHILGAGLADLGGTLDVQLLDGFIPNAGDTFEIITAANVLGTFDTINLPSLPGDLLWFINYGATSVSLVSTYGADFDEDGDVDDNDLATWEANFGLTPVGHIQGDANADTWAVGNDFLAWQRQFGLGGSPAVSAAVVVPEPASWMLSLMAFACFTTNRFRNR